MALTCSLLGHEFGDPELAREREERGSEVITSVREVVVCERCGAERVLSENTEIAAVVDEDEVDLAPPVGSDATDEVGAAADEADAATDDSDADAATDDEDAFDLEETPDPAEEDAIILTDGPDEREYGEWPTEAGYDYRPWNPDELLSGPDDGDPSGPTVAEAVGSDLDGSAAGASDADGVDDAAGDLDAGVEPAAEPASARDATYACGSCGYTVEAFRTSLRRGDACPSCRRGYLRDAERNH
ncbi:DUF7093 family protein [Halomarina pelagica]|uniref:DUF7093 family protein n=1 Tax=Halomarina pelagica TaxID=2961599 RepID=UPI0020C3D338|nr:hypothetical protein [Halomarina sp. BND7]